MELQRWVGVGGGKRIQGGVPSLRLAQLGAGVCKGGLRYELHARKCHAMCRIMLKSREGEGSPKPSHALGKDCLSPNPH